MKIHFKSALASIRRSPFQAASAIFVLWITFFVATLFSVLAYSSDKLLKYFETRPQVISFIKVDAKDVEIADLQHKLEADSKIKDVKYVSKEEALSIYKKATSNNPQLGELVSPSIFPASLEFSLIDLSFAKEIIENIKSEKIVDSVGFTASIGNNSDLSSVVTKLKNITSFVRIGGIILTCLLVLTSFVVLLVIVSMRLVSRREEIEILSLIGATQKFIRSPIVIEAVLYSIFGVLAGWLSGFVVILYIAPNLISFFGEIPIIPVNFIEVVKIFGIILGLEVIMGVFIAYLGSFIAVSRSRKVR